jgi:malate dehydrogenase
MSRDDLIGINLNIIKDVGGNLKRVAPDAFVIVITNPLDAMVYTMQRVTGFPTHMVCGMAGVLDSARLRYFIADALDVSVANVQALTLGGHGDTMVPIISSAAVGGVPVTELIDAETLDAIMKRTRKAGGEIVGLLGNGSAFFSPAAAAISMAAAYLHDDKAVLPAAAYLDGEYGLSGFYLGVPTIIGRGGIERVLEVPLTAGEQEALNTSAAAVQKLVGSLDI